MKRPLNYDLSLEQIEHDYWGASAYDSHLIQTCHSLRKKPLRDFTIEDLRIMIGQSISLPILIPLAIKELEVNIMAEGHYFEGDLLKNVLSSDANFWLQHKELWQKVLTIYQEQFEPNYLVKDIMRAYNSFSELFG